MYEDDISDYFGCFSDVLYKKEHPWFCPVCGQRFKWDTQLLRHERETGHQNPDRLQRRRRKFAKKESKICGLCFKQFETQLERLSHYPWCEAKSQNKLSRYRSSCQQYKFQCLNHELPHYFTTSEELLAHLQTHRKAKAKKQKNGYGAQGPQKKRVTLSDYHKYSLIKQLSKIKILSLSKIENLKMRFGVSAACIRKYFQGSQKAKRNQENNSEGADYLVDDELQIQGEEISSQD